VLYFNEQRRRDHALKERATAALLHRYLFGEPD
jgi:hypothetical protein